MVQMSNVVSAEMNGIWKQFLQSKVNSFIKWDLVRFFHDNPHTTDTADNIAQFVGRDAKIVRRELDGLVKSEVLLTESVSGQRIYRLSESEETRRLIREFVAACHSREFRVKAINQVMGFSSRHD
jgi:hypothetical protein